MKSFFDIPDLDVAKLMVTAALGGTRGEINGRVLPLYRAKRRRHAIQGIAGTLQVV